MMNPKFSLFVFGAIAVGLTILPVAPAHAQTPAKAGEAEAGLDLKLSPQQRRAIETLSDFAFDQMETLLANGLNPRKIDRVAAQRQTENLRQTMSSLRLDDQQKAVLRTVLQNAREQMRRQMNTK